MDHKQVLQATQNIAHHQALQKSPVGEGVNGTAGIDYSYDCIVV